MLLDYFWTFLLSFFFADIRTWILGSHIIVSSSQIRNSMEFAHTNTQLKTFFENPSPHSNSTTINSPQLNFSSLIFSITYLPSLWKCSLKGRLGRHHYTGIQRHIFDIIKPVSGGEEIMLFSTRRCLRQPVQQWGRQYHKVTIPLEQYVEQIEVKS